MLDLINFDLGGGNNPRRGQPRETSVVRDTRADRIPSGKESKAANQFFDILNVLSFDPKTFAWIFCRANIVIQRRAMECLLEVVDLLALRFDNGFYDTQEEMEWFLTAKRAQDAMLVYRQEGML